MQWISCMSYVATAVAFANKLIICWKGCDAQWISYIFHTHWEVLRDLFERCTQISSKFLAWFALKHVFLVFSSDEPKNWRKKTRKKNRFEPDYGLTLLFLTSFYHIVSYCTLITSFFLPHSRFALHRVIFWHFHLYSYIVTILGNANNENDQAILLQRRRLLEWHFAHFLGLHFQIGFFYWFFQSIE